jgi:hypothetical protein
VLKLDERIAPFRQCSSRDHFECATIVLGQEMGGSMERAAQRLNWDGEDVSWSRKGRRR